jgi:hypothetical protein
MKKGLMMAMILFVAVPSGFAQKFEIKLGVGPCYASHGDFAKGIKGQMAYLEDEYEVTGGYQVPYFGMIYAGECIYYFKKSMGIGLSFGYFKHVADEEVSYDIGYISVKERLKPRIDVFPVAVNFHFPLPLSAKFSMDCAGGVAYYLAMLKWDYKMSLSLLGFSGYDEYSFKSTTGGFGAQAGVSLSYALTSRIAVCFDILGRLVPASLFSRFKGDWTESGGGDIWDYYESRSDQFAWFYDWKSGENTYSQIVFQKERPSGSTVSNERYAKLSLTGFTATVSVRFGIGR